MVKEWKNKKDDKRKKQEINVATKKGEKDKNGFKCKIKGESNWKSQNLRRHKKGKEGNNNSKWIKESPLLVKR